MLELDRKLYEETKRYVRYLSNSYSLTSGVDSDELYSYAWAKIAYAVRFYTEGKMKKTTFIGMVAKSAMNEVFQNRDKLYKQFSYDEGNLTGTHKSDGENADSAEYRNNWQSLCRWDDTFLVDLKISLSTNSKRIVDAIINEGLQSKSDIIRWAKSNGYRGTEVNYCIFEIGTILKGRKVIHA
ncbi:MAG: hypothetical protein ACI4S2_06680 [Lachnospiraceae bacterium]